MVGQITMLATKASNAIMMAPVTINNMMDRAKEIMTVAEGEGSGSSIGQLDVKEIIEGAGDAMQTGGSFANSGVTEKIDNLGGGAYHLGYKVVIFLAIFAILGAGAGLMFANSNERQEKKSKIIWVAVGTALALGATAIVIFISTISNGLFGE